MCSNVILLVSQRDILQVFVSIIVNDLFKSGENRNNYQLHSLEHIRVSNFRVETQVMFLLPRELATQLFIFYHGNLETKPIQTRRM